MSINLDEHSVRYRQRLAWVVLLGSFFTCLIMTISVPVTVSAMLQNSTRLLDVVAQANQGTVRIDNQDGVAGALLEGEPGQSIEPNSSIVTGNTETALLFISPPGSDRRLARMQLYSNTILQLARADMPRFAMSSEKYTVSLNLLSGRVKMVLPPSEERPLRLTITTPQSEIRIQEPGEYTILVTNEDTQLFVLDGEAVMNSISEDTPPQTLELSAGQRAVAPTGEEPIGPFSTEHNLISNGDFGEGTNGWTFRAWRIERADQPKGTAEVIRTLGEPRLHVVRQGIGHADMWIRQSVRQDVTDVKALQLSLTFRLVGHDLAVCGVEGSECPLFVRLNYVDMAGFTQTWQHGFYAAGQVVNGATPDVCVGCALVQSNHHRVPLQQDYFFDVDLVTELTRLGARPPRFIESLELVFSGHSFEVEVVNVDLLADE